MKSRHIPELQPFDDQAFDTAFARLSRPVTPSCDHLCGIADPRTELCAFLQQVIIGEQQPHVSANEGYARTVGVGIRRNTGSRT